MKWKGRKAKMRESYDEREIYTGRMEVDGRARGEGKKW